MVIDDSLKSYSSECNTKAEGKSVLMDFLTLFISLRCTQKCAHCLYGCSPEHGDHMSWDVFMRSLAIAEKSRIGMLNFFGGEPTLNPRFFLMLQAALEKNFALIVATNCRLFAKGAFFGEFLNITKQYKERIVLVTATDRFHLRFFDPAEVVNRLRKEGYEVVVNDYSDHTVALTKYNAEVGELRQLNTHFSCCNARPRDYLGVLPDGGWAICPASLEAFGNIFINKMEDIVAFKHTIPLYYQEGCTKCLKDFKSFRERFETNGQ